MTAGEALREQGIQDVLFNDAEGPGYGDLVRAALDELIDSGQRFTAEDVRRLVARDHPTAVPHSANTLPAVMGSAARQQQIVAVGMAKPTRASRRHSRILTWVGAA